MAEIPKQKAHVMFTNDIESAYRARRDSIANAFPAAYEFLGSLETLASDGAGFHLGTAENIHFYLGPRFLAYIKLDLGTPSTPRLSLLAKYNVALKVGTFDDSGALFGRVLDRLVMKHGGFKDGWAVKAKGAEAVSFTRETPPAFFADVVQFLRNLADEPVPRRHQP